jgi:hypothetical protein
VVILYRRPVHPRLPLNNMTSEEANYCAPCV